MSTGELSNWLYDVWRAVNDIPNLSYFSSSTSPNSNLTGRPGDLAVNPNSTTTKPRFWIMGGSSTNTTLGWLPVTVGEP